MNHRIVLSVGWQKHAAQHGCVFSRYAASIMPEHLTEYTDPNATVKHGRRVELKHDAQTRADLIAGNFTFYTDLADFGHPLLSHPVHPMARRATIYPTHTRPEGMPTK